MRSNPINNQHQPWLPLRTDVHSTMVYLHFLCTAIGAFLKAVFPKKAVQILLMAAEMETTGVWLPDEGFLFNQTWMSTIKAHIRSYVIKLAHSDKDMKDESFIGPFNQMLLQF